MTWLRRHQRDGISRMADGNSLDDHLIDIGVITTLQGILHGGRKSAPTRGEFGFFRSLDDIFGLKDLEAGLREQVLDIFETEEADMRTIEQPPFTIFKITVDQARRNCGTVSYTHLRAHETVLDLVCRLLLEKKKSSLHKLRHLALMQC